MTQANARRKRRINQRAANMAMRSAFRRAQAKKLLVKVLPGRAYINVGRKMWPSIVRCGFVEKKITRPEKARESAASFEGWLVYKGFKRLGSGAFSTVYAKEGSDRAIKVCRNSDGWPQFVFWAKEKGYSGNYAPKVFGFKRYNWGSMNEFYVAIVERLDYTVGHSYTQKETGKADMVYQLLGWEKNNPYVRSVIEAHQPGLLKFKEEFKATFGRGDLHGGNLMVRKKDDTLVFNDPVAENYDVVNVPARFRGGQLPLAALH